MTKPFQRGLNTYLAKNLHILFFKNLSTYDREDEINKVIAPVSVPVHAQNYKHSDLFVCLSLYPKYSYEVSGRNWEFLLSTKHRIQTLLLSASKYNFPRTGDKILKWISAAF